MALPRSLLKSVEKLPEGEQLRLFCSGAVFTRPTPELTGIIRHLANSQLINLQERRFVRCTDYAVGEPLPRNHSHCDGKIYLRDDADESGNDYQCPECNRNVYPKRYRKEEFQDLLTTPYQEGILAKIEGELRDSGFECEVRGLGEFRLKQSFEELDIFVLDYCREGPWARVNYATTRLVRYVLVDTSQFHRIAVDARSLVIAFLDCLLKPDDFRKWLENAFDGPTLERVANSATPVFTSGTHSKLFLSDALPPVEEKFLIRRELTENGIRFFLEGQELVKEGESAKARILSVFWEHFLEEMKKGTSPSDLQPLPLKDVVNRLQKGCGEFFEEENVRKNINRLQEAIGKVLRRELGLRFDGRDILETVEGGPYGKPFGYRLNPRLVVPTF